MRILHTADWHIGKKLDFYSRLEEQEAVLKEIIAIAEEQRVDMVIVAGDLFDNYNPANDAMELLYRTLNKLGKGGKVPVIAIAGNHDSPERINVPDVFARTNGVIFIGKPTDVVPLFKTDDGFEIIRTDVGFIEIKLPQYSYPVRVFHTAFANEVRLKEYFGTDKQKSLQESLAAKWQALAEKYGDEKGVNLLTTHLFIQKRGEEKPEEPDGEKPLNIGNADVVYSDAIPPQVQYTALGHLHGYSNVGMQSPAVYSSSPLCYSFSEAGNQKYAVIVDAEPGKEVEVNRIPLKSGRPLVRKSFDSVMDAVEWLEQNPGCLVELTVRTDEFMTAAEQKQIRSAHDGIIFLIPKVRSVQGNAADGDGDVHLELSDIRGWFRDYFMSRNAGQEPNQEIMDLFNEILSADVTD